MPVCRTCGRVFPNRVIIDDRRRMLCNRKHCLECSPFGRHNTRASLEALRGTAAERVCAGCGRRFLPNRSQGHHGYKCNTCVVHKHREAVKAKAIAYKGGKCILCGYSKCSAALHFHHVDGSEKDFSIGGNHTRAWAKVQAELDKCILVCANCHAELHSVRAPLVQRSVQ